MAETEMAEDVLARLKAACVGHPNAKIAWPHRLLHDAIAEIERLRPASVVPADVQKVAREATMGWMAAGQPESNAALIASVERAVMGERERCAGITDGLFDKLYGEPSLQASHERDILNRIATAIRNPSP